MNSADHDILCQNFLKAFEGAEGKYPRNLEESYPRILEKIIMLWGSPEIDDCLNDLLIDTRGGRAGFPAEVMAEIFNLQNLHDRLYPKGNKDH